MALVPGRKLLLGELVEVRQPEKGLRGSWHPGVVVQVKPGRRLVEYEELLSKDGKSKLIESIPFDNDFHQSRSSSRLQLEPGIQRHRGIIRPRPPQLRNVNTNGWKRGLFVEVFYEDAWWEAIILESKDEESSVKVWYPHETYDEWVLTSKLRILQKWNEETGLWKVTGYGFLPCFFPRKERSAGLLNDLQGKTLQPLKLNEVEPLESQIGCHANIESTLRQDTATCILAVKVRRRGKKGVDIHSGPTISAREMQVNNRLKMSHQDAVLKMPGSIHSAQSQDVDWSATPAAAAKRRKLNCGLNMKDDCVEGLSLSLKMSYHSRQSFLSNSYEEYLSSVKENLKEQLNKSNWCYFTPQTFKGKRISTEYYQQSETHLKTVQRKGKEQIPVTKASKDDFQYRVSSPGVAVSNKVRKVSRKMSTTSTCTYSVTSRSQKRCNSKESRRKRSTTSDKVPLVQSSDELPPLSLATLSPKEESNSYLSSKKSLFACLIDKGVIQEFEVVRYLRRKDNSVMKEGCMTRKGVLCSCCRKVWHLSSFEAHAGSCRHRPAANMFIEDGRSLSECLYAIRGELPKRLSRKINERKVSVHSRGIASDQINDSATDDFVCRVCGDGGDLICCENCPSIFHLECLGMKDVPTESWFCPSCQCAVCNGFNFSNNKVRRKGTRMFKCAQCERRYHISCLKSPEVTLIEETCDGSNFCGKQCQKIFSSLRSLVGKSARISGNLSWTLVRSKEERNGNTRKVKSLLSAALNALLECFNPMVDSHTNIEIIAHLVHNRPCKFQRLNFCGFYILLLHKGPQVVSVATMRVHGAHFAEIPFIGTRFQYRRKGMCRLLLSIAEQLLTNLEVERLVLPAISELKETWQRSFGFQPLTPTFRKQVVEHNIFSSTGGTLLEKPISTKKLEEEMVHQNGNVFASSN